MRTSSLHLMLAAFVLLPGLLLSPAPPAEAGEEKRNTPTREQVEAAGRKLQPLQRKKRRPDPGDWLAEHREPGQNFLQYAAVDPNRPNGKRTTIYIQPLGQFTAEEWRLVELTQDFLARFYGLPVKVSDRIDLGSLPGFARRASRGFGEQIHTGYLLDDVLAPRRRADAVATLALTRADLYPEEKWNFVFGEASLQNRVGVWSIARNGDPALNFSTALSRTLKVAAHETGHMLGMYHCIAYECGMNGSNSLAETDRTPLAFCSECEQKVWWACGVDPIERYEALVDFAERHRMSRELQNWRARLQLLRK